MVIDPQKTDWDELAREVLIALGKRKEPQTMILTDDGRVRVVGRATQAARHTPTSRIVGTYNHKAGKSWILEDLAATLKEA